jgi:cytochrome c2
MHDKSSWKKFEMRTVLTWLAVFLMGVCSAWGQKGTADDVRKGRHLATMLCTTCHVVAPDQSYEPTLSPPGPSFESIAQRKDISAELLQKFLTTTHQGLDNPGGMPNPNLADFQVEEIVAYLLSLRK